MTDAGGSAASEEGGAGAFVEFAREAEGPEFAEPAALALEWPVPGQVRTTLGAGRLAAPRAARGGVPGA